MSITRFYSEELTAKSEAKAADDAEVLHSQSTGQHAQKTAFPASLQGGRYAGLENVLLVCGDNMARTQMRNFLELEHYRITEASWGEEAVSMINNETSAVLIDSGSNDTQTELLCRHFIERFPEVPVVLLDEPHNDPARRKHLSQMVFVYASKPCDRSWLLNVVNQACKLSRLIRENRILRQSVGTPLVPIPMAGNSVPMQTLRKQIESFSRLDNTIFITGEAGTGKSVIAQQIHQASARVRYPFLVISCNSVFPETLEADLFGYVRGAIPGLLGERPGKLQLAARGTVFLDHVEALSPSLQARLFSFLRDRAIQRVGSQDSSLLDTRIIAATSSSLAVACAQGRFREDLYFRLNSLTLTAPPLRERYEDISALAREIVARIARLNGENLPILSNGAMNKLRQYSWPGNIREMEAVLQKAMATANDTVIGEDDISFDTINSEAVNSQGSMGLAGLTMTEIERRAIIETINACSGNRAQSARKLGLSEKTIYNKIKQFKLRGIV